MDIVAEKSRLLQERRALHQRLRLRPTGREAARAISQLNDGLLERIFRELSPPPRAALVALGGYGREECAPFSDVDVMVLLAGEAEAEAGGAFATRFFQALWDVGLTLGHSVRTVDDAARALERDLVSATAIVEGRLLGGDAEAFAALDARRKEFLARSGEEFLRRKCLEADERRRKHGGSLHAAEPDVKSGAGGLRDLELVRLFERAGAPPIGIPLLDEDGRAALDDALERLLEIRLVMHLVEGKKQDRLGFDLGPRIAPALRLHDAHGASGAERLMADFYRTAKDVDRALRAGRHALSRRLAERAEFAPEHRPRRVGARFVALGGEIDLARKDALQGEGKDQSPLLELFAAAQREKLEVAEPSIEAVRRRLHHLSEAERRSPALARLFRGILAGRTRVAGTLRAMHRAGLLGEYLPEFGGLDGLWRPDPYHEYTVDEHSLRCVEALERFAESREREDEIRAEVHGGLARRDVLALAVLLHDMGKGKAIDHVSKGVEMAGAVALRLGLSKEEYDLLAFLIEEHLSLSRATEARDISSEETLAHVCDRVVRGDEERLDMLFLLTAADMRGVGAGTLPRWKDALLTTLYQLAKERLRGHARAPLSAEQRRAEVLARLPAGLGAPDLDRHLSLAPERYALEVEPFDCALHVRLVRDLEGGRDPATAHVVEGALRQFWVCTRDRKGLFATIAGALAARGASIVGADAYTRSDGVVLDKLALVVPPEQADDGAFWEELLGLLRDVLSGGRRIEDVVAAARARVPYRAAPKAPPRPPEIAIDNALSERFTVVDVGAEDRTGLLYDLAHALAALGLDIHFSKISTRANRAADVFYVTRDGRRVESAEEIEALRGALLAALGEGPAERP